MTASAHTAPTTPRSGAPAPAATPRRTRGRAATGALWVLQILLAAMFIFAGINKLLGLMPEVIEGFAKIGFGQWFRYLTGALELAGGIGLLIPRLSGLAALGLAGVMVGAIVAHLTVLFPAYQAVGPLILGVLLLLVVRARLHELRA